MNSRKGTLGAGVAIVTADLLVLLNVNTIKWSATSFHFTCTKSVLPGKPKWFDPEDLATGF
jgi:hypothetical protein